MATKNGYQSRWQSQLDDLTDKILNREKFSYDLNGDAFYNQYKDKFTQQGKMAMMDTIGQAAALTGGYGSSYAQQVGQQAYQGYLQNLNDVVPELYQMALDNYDRQGDALNQKYSLLADQDALDYSRHRDAVSDSQWQQSFDYQKNRDSVSDSQWQKQYDAQYDSGEDESDNTDAGGGILSTIVNKLFGKGTSGNTGLQPTASKTTEAIAQSIDGNIAIWKMSGWTDERIREAILGTLRQKGINGSLTDGEMEWLTRHYEKYHLAAEDVLR